MNRTLLPFCPHRLCTWSEQPYGVESNQLRKDLGAILESAQLAQGIAPSYRTAAKLRSPPILVRAGDAGSQGCPYKKFEENIEY